jgi:hypothetical protein
MTTIYKAILKKDDNKTVEYIEPYSMSQYGRNDSVITDCLDDPKRTSFRYVCMHTSEDGWRGAGAQGRNSE